MTSPDMEKLKAMVHYIVARMPEIDKTKLNAILWQSDREAYIKLGQTISGDTYIREEAGPVSANLDKALDELVKEGALKQASK